jgi:hypothetical protein
MIKASRFCTNKNKQAYIYLLTPKGIEDKALVTLRYLRRRMKEYDEIREEIALIKEEMGKEKDKDRGANETVSAPRVRGTHERF